MANKEFMLKNGSKIAVIGGGPAGSFFARFAQKMAKEKGIDIQVTIFEGKDFTQKGPKGCNMSAAVISETLFEKLEKQDISIPDNCIQQRIEGYHFQTQDFGISLRHPEPSHQPKIVTVFRGNGPWFSTQTENISFDDFLLRDVEGNGTQVIHEVVKEIILPSSFGEKARLIYESGGTRHEMSYDLIVGAFGGNTGMVEKVRRLNFGYRPPRTIRTCQTEIPLGKATVERIFGNKIYVLFLDIGQVRYSTITPRGDFATVTLVGKKDISKVQLLEFLNHPVVKRIFPEGWKMPKSFCICFPKVHVTQAKHPYANRFLIIGGAGVTRYFKNEIESAFISAEMAVKAIFEHGVSENALRDYYYKPAKRLLAPDKFYGRLIFAINNYLFSRRQIVTNYLTMLDAKDNSDTRRHREILWNTFTGNEPYKKTFFKAIDPRLQIKLLPFTLRVWVKQIVENVKGGRKFRHSRTLKALANKGIGPLTDGQTVVIVGGGPAGVSCAITLKSIAAKRNIDLNIVLYEGKDFERDQQFNPCVGVLSPPIEQIIEQDLNIPFPHHLVLRKIAGYYLHSDDDEIKLNEDGEVSYAVRRLEFDEYLLQKAKEAGINVKRSRVTNIDIEDGGVMVYSESDNCRADVIVGAFGLDDGTCRALEISTSYKAPRYLSSIMTRFSPDKHYIDKSEDYIHAFLPSLKGIEFGAVTPKADHFTINIAGANVSWHWMDTFLLLPQVNSILPPDFTVHRNELVYNQWRFPIRPAKHLFGDRYVTVGDAAGLIRAFKGKGVNVACITGIKAANIMMDVGISREAFKDYYNSFSEVVRDIPYGKIVRQLAILSTKHGLLTPMIQLAKRDAVFRRVLYHSVSGDKMFKEIIDESKSLKLTGEITKVIIIWLFESGLGFLRGWKHVRKHLVRKGL
jgi:flavin-dependent dehydrogenase